MKMMKKENKAQSNIITTVLIILLVIAGIVILSAIVINFLKNKGGDIAEPTVINSVIKDAYAIDGGNNMNIIVNRNIGKGNLSVIIFNLMDNSDVIHRANLTNPPKEGEMLTYNMRTIFGPGIIGNFSNIKKVSIQYGILEDDGQISISNTISEFEIKSGTVVPPAACTPMELLTCGDFECDGAMSYWSYDENDHWRVYSGLGGYANFDSSDSVGHDSLYPAPSLTLVAGKTYNITYSITDWTNPADSSNYLDVIMCGDPVKEHDSSDENGIYSVKISCGSDTSNLNFNGYVGGSLSFKLDNVSVKTVC